MEILNEQGATSLRKTQDNISYNYDRLDKKYSELLTKDRECFVDVDANVTQQPTGKLGPVAEMGIMADAIYRMGYRESACVYAVQGLNAVLGGNKADIVPRKLLQNWESPNIETMFVRMWLKLFMLSLYHADRKDAEEVMKYWISQEPQSAEPFIRFGLLRALHASRDGCPVPSDALEALLQANRLLNNERSATALLLVENSILKKLVVPYDSVHLWVYPDIKNMTTYVLLEQGDWFEDEIALFRDLIRPGDRILDLGANVGVYSISAAQRTGSNGRVISVEPCNETFKLLDRSAAAFDNMTAINIAVGDKNGRGYLELDSGPEFNKVRAGEGDGEAVNITSVDELAERVGIDHFDLIKIDVEGYEIPTIRGAKKIIEEGDPIIFYEAGGGKSVDLELVDVFQKLGYDSYFFWAPRKALIRFSRVNQPDLCIINMVAARPGSLNRLKEVVCVE